MALFNSRKTEKDCVRTLNLWSHIASALPLQKRSKYCQSSFSTAFSTSYSSKKVLLLQMLSSSGASARQLKFIVLLFPEIGEFTGNIWLGKFPEVKIVPSKLPMFPDGKKFY